MFKIALFGAGRIGQVHAASIARHPRTALHRVVDIAPEAATRVAEAHGGTVCTGDAAMDDPDIDAVVIASATDTHADLIEQAARAGKAIFCEKPIDLSLDRVRACLRTVEEHRGRLLVGFNRRFDSSFRALREAYQSGRIGRAEALFIISRDPAPPPIGYLRVCGGLFRDMTVHDLDLSRWLIGEEPCSVMAAGSCMVDPAFAEVGDIDTAVLTLEFPSGCLATVTNSRRTTYGYDQRIELHGSEGMLQAGNVLQSTVVTTDGRGQCAEKPVFFFLERYASAYAAEWDHFVEVLQGDAEPSVTGVDGERSLAIADAALEALRTGQRQILSS